jgi:hypothetical protein
MQIKIVTIFLKSIIDFIIAVVKKKRAEKERGRYLSCLSG